ncbi:MAG: ATP-binding cassette domain-containing protein [Firmicutes bacterium]|nr:ATP-binding cassette domain-containing protein [Bacillota bacterium]
MPRQDRLLEIGNLQKHFPIRKGLWRREVGVVKAVDGVDLSIDKGRVLGLVGESGCGKTTTGRCILRAIEPTAGEIHFRMNGEFVDVAKLGLQKLRELRRHMQMIFQDPYASLNPRMTVKDIIGEPLVVNGLAKGRMLEDSVVELMKKVGLRPEYLRRYPHAFSGGQRQRIGIARALALNPSLIVCDESVSALDVSIQAQILNLLKDLQSEFGLTYLFIAHDLSVVRHISDNVAVMYIGKIAEVAETDTLFESPKHPYTEALLSAVPLPDPRAKLERILLSGETADPTDTSKGCYFHPRCAYSRSLCAVEMPKLRSVAGPGQEEHLVACHYAEDLSLKGIEAYTA